MKSSIRLAFVCLLILGCEKEKINDQDVIFDLRVSNTKPIADGSVIVDLSVKLNPDADVDKRNVVFKANVGGFGTLGDTVIIQKAIFEGSALIAKARFKVSNTPRKITFTALPELRSKFGDFMVTTTIESQFSPPNSLVLFPSASGVTGNFAGEVQLVGSLKGASSGCQVLFEDFLMDGTPAGGRYRQRKESTDALSQVSTFYAPGRHAVGTDIRIRCTYLDPNGNRTNIFGESIIAIISP